MASPLKLASKETITGILAQYKGTTIKAGSALPPNYSKVSEKEGDVLKRTFVYKDFK